MPGQPGQVGGELALEQLDPVRDRLPHRRRPGGPLPGDEPEVLPLLVHVLDQDLSELSMMSSKAGSLRRTSRSIARSETKDSSTRASPSASIESKCR